MRTNTFILAAVGMQQVAQGHRFDRHRHLARATLTGADRVVAGRDPNLCLDVLDNRLVNNQPVQMWQCFGSANQQWSLQGGQLQTAAGLCLDVPDGQRRNGVKLQVYRCHTDNTNQRFEQVGPLIRWQDSDLCLDITDGRIQDGTRLQLWACDTNNPNQALSIGGKNAPAAPASTTMATATTTTPAPAPIETELPWCDEADGADGIPDDELAGTYLGYPHIAFDAFMALHPVLAPLAEDILDAADAMDIGLVPILLGAIALQESSGNPQAPNGGLCQFQNMATWNQFSEGGNMYDGRDNLFAAARYLKDLLSRHSNSLDAALNEYSGSNPSYLRNIRSWLQGELVYGPGT